MRKPIAIIILVMVLTLATFGCTSGGVAQEDFDTLEANVSGLEGAG